MVDPSPAVEVRDLHFAYEATPVLRGVTFTLFPGELTAITGANGSGKSTLLELVAGVRSPAHGTIAFRGDLSLVLQQPDAPRTLPLTGRETVSIGTWKRGFRISSADRRRAVSRALERVGMSELADRPLATLSGGQRQRIFVAQGIVRRPDVLLLDEPSAGLDAASAERTQHILSEEVARGAAVVCITHDRSESDGADREIRLAEGRVSNPRDIAGRR